MRNVKKWIGLLGLWVVSAVSADNYFWGNVRFDGGGFVSAVVPSKSQADLIYVRTDVGGIYRWDATNSQWIPLMDWISQIDVGLLGAEALALDPQDPAKVYVLAGTSYFSNGKTAIFRSSDYGNTWDSTVVTDLFKAHGNGMGRQTGEKLAVDPHNSNVLFCGSRLKGLFKSSDGGVSWSQADTLGANSGSLTNDIGISFVLFDPNSTVQNGVTSTLFIGVGRSSRNLFVSHNGGASFSEITGGPTQMPMRAVLNAGSLFITYSASSGPHSVSTGSVWKYNLQTSVWTNITPKEDDGTLYGSGGQSHAHGFGGISVDPNNALHMVLSTVNFYGGNQGTSTTGAGPWGDQLFYTVDGGATWTPIFKGKSSLDPNGNQWIVGHAIHWAGSIEFDPFNPKKVWIVSGNGVFQTDDITATAQVWKYQSRGIEETVPLDIVSVPGGPLVTAIGDYDGAAYTDITASTPLHSPSIGTTYSLGYGALNGSFLRAGQVTDYSTGTGISSLVMYYSTDTAKTWTAVESVKGLHGMLAMNADGSVFFHKPENTVTFWRSADKGKTWSEVTGLNSQSQYAPIVPDPVNADKLYLLDGMGDMFASSDAGASFSKVGSVVDNSKNELSASDMKIRTVPGREGEIWVPLDQHQTWVPTGYSENGLAFSSDGGKTFTRFPSVKTCVSIGLGKAKEGAEYFTLYMWGATTNGPIGVYRSTDKGASWERINDDKHQFGGPGNGNFVVGDMNVYGRVYMSGAGRGLVYGNIDGPASSTANQFKLNLVSPHHLQVNDQWIEVYAKGYSHLVLEMVDVQGTILQKTPILQTQTQISLKHLPKTAVFARLRSGSLQLESIRLP